MIVNYILTCYRNIVRKKSIFFVNLIGLSLGITSAMLLFMIVDYLQNFDADQTNKTRIYRAVTSSQGSGGRIAYNSGVATVFPDALRNDFPEVEAAVFTSYQTEGLIVVPRADGSTDKFLELVGVVYTEPSFFDVFHRPVLRGDARKALDEPNEAVISERWATRYFGTDDPIGKTIEYQEAQFIIKAVVSDVGLNSNIPFHLFLSYATIKAKSEERGWGSVSSNEQCYFLLKEGTSIDHIKEVIKGYADKHMGDQNYNKTIYEVQRFDEMHFDKHYDVYSERSVEHNTLLVFMAIGLVLIITACINFINLSTADAIRRSKEIGIRKTLGSSRFQLVVQLLGESTLITIIAMLLSIGAVYYVLGYVNDFLTMELSLQWDNPFLINFVLIVTVFVSLFSGLYPAIVVSGYQPVAALKNQFQTKQSSNYMLRKLLVVCQFTITQIFIIGTIVLVLQNRFMANKDLGYNKEAVMVVPIPLEKNAEERTIKLKAMETRLLAVDGIEQLSYSRTPPSSDNISFSAVTIADQSSDPKMVQLKQVDHRFVDLYGIELLAGRNLEQRDTIDGVLVSEQFASISGYETPAEMVGVMLKFWGITTPVVGVFKNIHTVRLKNEMYPLMMFSGYQHYMTMSLKVDIHKLDAVKAQVKNEWEQAFPNYLFEINFLDESIKRFYEGERKMTTMLMLFSGIAIFIGCIGLFGLVTYLTNQKVKEVGIRKVLGASVSSLVWIFSWEFVKLVLIGFVIAVPVAWFAMNTFLETFAYRISIEWYIMFMAFALTVTVALLTVMIKSYRAASVNPVNSLRSE
jgi:putative ABC transport system permease protein